jgi:hypothetical protein
MGDQDVGQIFCADAEVGSNGKRGAVKNTGVWVLK